MEAVTWPEVEVVQNRQFIATAVASAISSRIMRELAKFEVDYPWNMYKEAVSSVRATRHENRRFNSAIYFKFFNQISPYYNRLISHLNIENFACDCQPTWEAFDTRPTRQRWRRSLANSTTFSCVLTWRQHSQKQYVNKLLLVSWQQWAWRWCIYCA